jgi:WhiB family transcriptional regulator, redox-sensing transcriptional regulator
VTVDLVPYIRTFEDQPWREHAACAGKDPDMFFPGRGEATAPAKKVCNSCPVKADCLDHALTHREAFGIWAGTSERERRVLRRQYRQGAA